MKFTTIVFILGSAWLGLSACQTRTPQAVKVNLLALNDFHGYVQPSTFDYRDPLNPAQNRSIQAGGIAALGGLVNQLRRDDPELLFVGVGDLIGASPTMSSMFADEPILSALGMLRLNVSTVGNHEFDEGKGELLRQINGGCDSPRPEQACQFSPDYAGSGFPYVAANVLDVSSQQPVLKPYEIIQLKGLKIAFIGAQVKELHTMVSAKAMQGIVVSDEADAINHYVAEIQQQGVRAIVAVIHQGGSQTGSYNQCENFSGPIVDIAERLDPEVDVVLSAHSHQAYICQLGRLTITQGDAYGHLLSHLQLTLDPLSGDITAVEAENLLVDPATIKADPSMQALAEEMLTRSNAVTMRPIAPIGARLISAQRNHAGESAMGVLIADAQLAATHSLGAHIAFMNESGIRSQLSLQDGQDQVVYGQITAVHPFKGSLILMTMTGAQLKALLEQQWLSDEPTDFRPLQPSSSLQYRWSASRPLGDRVLTASIRIDGQPLDLHKDYRITVNSYLAGGGADFSLFKQGSDRYDSGIADAQALIDYLQTAAKAGQPAGRAEAAQRIIRLD